MAAEKTRFLKYEMSIDGWSLRFSWRTKTTSTAMPAATVARTAGSVKSASWPPLMMP